MFADLAGFTKWSSSRSPCEVFELLENLYESFDRIASKRGVFKVETIGDCYLAVCGLPDPNPNHAVVMVSILGLVSKRDYLYLQMPLFLNPQAKFARDCSVKMNEIVREVSERLGSETRLLRLRVGLHSGAVTAGVLRGQKSRFQLFGDTVNVASRMESTGQAGRIQVSQETADELVAKGKKSWLKMREDKVNAKGKGELTTYWVSIRTQGSVQSTASLSVASGHLRDSQTTTVPMLHIEEDEDSGERFVNETCC